MDNENVVVELTLEELASVGGGIAVIIIPA